MASHSSGQSSSTSNPTSSSSSSGSASTSKSSVEPSSNASGGGETSSGSPPSSYQSSSSSSSGSAQTVSTMPLSTDQEVVDEVDGPVVKSWGQLLPRNDRWFRMLELQKESYMFGRKTDCDYIFARSIFADDISLFTSLSNQHFKIFKEPYGSDPKNYTVFLRDLSRNGTQVNGETVGQNKTKTIDTGDEISICNKRAFIFINNTESEEQQGSYPKELKEKYTISKLLGSGACGEVRLAFDRISHKPYAIKIISKRKFSVGVKSRSSTSMLDEVTILRELDHPGIIKLEDFFDVDDALYIVLELVSGGELFDRVENLGKFDETISKLYFYQMLLAVDFLHSNSITHRDLKPENVLLATDKLETAIKITDFGLSRIVGENSLMQTLCGTPNYLAPEILRTHGMGGYSKAVDCWSLGCILYICLGGYPPFSDNVRDMTMYQQVLAAAYTFPDSHWKDISSEAKDLIKRLLTVDATKRITVSAALNHPWLQDKEMKEKAHSLMYPDGAVQANIPVADALQPLADAPPADASPADAPPADEQPANGVPSNVPQPNLDQPDIPHGSIPQRVNVDQVDMPPPPKIPAIRKLSSSSDEAPPHPKRRRTSTEDDQKEPTSD